MAYTLWSQDIFSKGELSPFMYARATVNEYSNGLKTAQNVLTYPTGAAGKRFGTLFQSILTTFTNFDQLYFETFQADNNTVYQLVFAPLTISIYLEGLLVFTVTTTLNAPQVFEISSTVLTGNSLGGVFRVATIGTAPYDLTRKFLANNPIVSVASNIITVSGAALPVDVVLPIQIGWSTTAPTTSRSTRHTAAWLVPHRSRVAATRLPPTATCTEAINRFARRASSML